MVTSVAGGVPVGAAIVGALPAAPVTVGRLDAVDAGVADSDGLIVGLVWVAGVEGAALFEVPVVEQAASVRTEIPAPIITKERCNGRRVLLDISASFFRLATNSLR